MADLNITCTLCHQPLQDYCGHFVTPPIYINPDLMGLQIKQNELISDYNKQQWEQLHKESEISFDNERHPIKQVALEVALELEKRLTFEGPYSGEITTGSLHELIYTAVQLLRTFGND